ncbi:MAG: SMI1/KNR4 family protein [Polyangiaceae bacterium]|nr:SMI1/KNR4 family protein [Polyangiaceae bacterium]
MPFPLDPARVDAAERAFGARFPRAYRDSMILGNGGSVTALDEDWQLHPISDDSDAKRLKRTCNDVLRETTEARAWPGFPEGALVIGSNGSGDLLVFLPAKQDGELGDVVYRFDHETSGLEPVAESFGALPWRAG